MEEIWKDIPGYENLYQASNMGRIRSLNYNKTGEIKIMKPGKYYQSGKERWNIDLSKNGQKNKFRWARCIYSAFYGPIPEGMQVNHIDENPTNNMLDNLNLMSAKENCNWGTRNRKISKVQRIPITQILPDGTEVFSFFSATAAEKELGIPHQNIQRCCCGKLKSAGGFRWRYAE